MPVQPTYPGLYIEELSNLVHTITAAPTSITVFVGYVHPFQGECADPNKPLWGKPIRIFTFADYERVFGGLFRNKTIGQGDVAYAVYQFFLNGGSDAYVIGLQPQFFEKGGNGVEPIVGANQPLSGITFTARELTDDAHKLTVTIRNVSVARDTADIIVTYGTQVESLRGVRLGSSPAALAHDHFINKRLAKESRLVTGKPAAGAVSYGDTFSISGIQERIELVDMPSETFGTPQAPTEPEHFRAQDFVDVFKDKGELDKLNIFNLLVIPGVTDLAVSNAGLAFCEKKQAFFIMDPPESATTDSIQEMIDDGRLPTTPASGALYYPFLNVPDPLGAGEIRLPPSGSVAGIFARTDTRRGVWKAPAGFEASILNTRGVVEEGRMTDMEQGVLNRIGVNVLRSFPGAGTVVWGARTIVTNSPAGEQWRYVPVRRMALFIEQTLLRNLGWAVFEPNDEPLWAAIRLSIDGFLLSLFNQNAFQGRTPSEAFSVKCDKTTTSQTDINLGIVNIVVGFRPLKPAEFVIIKIAQLAGQAQA